MRPVPLTTSLGGRPAVFIAAASACDAITLTGNGNGAVIAVTGISPSTSDATYLNSNG